MVSNLLLHCFWTYSLWVATFAIVGVNWVIAGTVVRELRAWFRICGKKGEKELIRMVTFSYFWTVEVEEYTGF